MYVTLCQRDVVIGKLSESNQIHMLFVGHMAYVTFMEARHMGMDPLGVSDYESLRAVSVAAGWILTEGGPCLQE